MRVLHLVIQQLRRCPARHGRTPSGRLRPGAADRGGTAGHLPARPCCTGERLGPHDVGVSRVGRKDLTPRRPRRPLCLSARICFIVISLAGLPCGVAVDADPDLVGSGSATDATSRCCGGRHPKVHRAVESSTAGTLAPPCYPGVRAGVASWAPRSGRVRRSPRACAVWSWTCTVRQVSTEQAHGDRVQCAQRVPCNGVPLAGERIMVGTRGGDAGHSAVAQPGLMPTASSSRISGFMAYRWNVRTSGTLARRLKTVCRSRPEIRLRAPLMAGATAALRAPGKRRSSTASGSGCLSRQPLSGELRVCQRDAAAMAGACWVRPTDSPHSRGCAGRDDAAAFFRICSRP
jgi:hypothetical protein